MDTFWYATIPVMIMKRSWIAILTLLTQLVDQHAQRTIEYLKEENKILYHKLGKKRLDPDRPGASQVGREGQAPGPKAPG